MVFVVTNNYDEVRKLAKEKWDIQEKHVDGIQKISVIDGYRIKLEATNEIESIDIDNKYAE